MRKSRNLALYPEVFTVEFDNAIIENSEREFDEINSCQKLKAQPRKDLMENVELMKASNIENPSLVETNIVNDLAFEYYKERSIYPEQDQIKIINLKLILVT